MKKSWKIIIGVVAVCGIGVGAYFGVNVIYHAGVDAGKNELSQGMSENLKALGLAVSEKNSLQQTINDTLDNTPVELTTEGIDEYIAKLDDLIRKINIDTAKEALKEYQARWQEFKETYTTEDNAAITESFDKLKTAAVDTAVKLRTSYDDAIREALNNL